MTSIRTSVIALLVALVVVGCGSSAASSAPADAGNGTGAAATADAGSGSGAAAAADSGSGSGSGTGSAEEAAAVGDQLKPPNSSETSKTTTEGYWYAVYHSTDSPDSLKSFYEGQIPKAGLKIISTTSASGSYVWVVARDETGSFGGSVTVGPAADGSGGSDVIVGIGSNN